MGQRLGCYDVVRFRLLPFVEPLGLRAVAQRKVRRLDKGPGEVLVAVLSVPFPFFAIAIALTINAPRIGGKMANARESVDRASLQQEHRGQYPPDTWHIGQQPTIRPNLDPFLQTLLDQLDLRRKCLDDGQVRFNR